MEVDRQIALVERAIRDRDGGLILAPDHPVALSTAVARAAGQGMRVVIIDARLRLPESLHVACLLNDEDRAGELAAERAARLVAGRGTVAVLGSATALGSTMERSAAFRRVMAERYPAVTVIDPLPGVFRTSLAEQETEDLMAKHPEVRAIVTLSVGATRGVYRGLKLLQRIPGVGLVACDQDLDLLYYLRHGEIDAVIAQNTFAMGYEAARLVMHPEPARGCERFAPSLVTRENVDSRAVQQVLTMDWRRGS
jgi:ribose transport system substrate-binding protein